MERLREAESYKIPFIYDGVPWNNNNAEYAIKAFAMFRHAIEGLTTEKGLRDYLVMLSIFETCKYNKVDFLDFLLSGEKDIGAFAKAKRRGQVLYLGRITLKGILKKNKNKRF